MNKTKATKTYTLDGNSNNVLSTLYVQIQHFPTFALIWHPRLNNQKIKLYKFIVKNE